MTYFQRFLCVSILFLAVTTSAKAETETYMLERPHTQVIFFVDHMGFAKSSGKFLQVDGTFTIDSENPANSSIDVSIPTALINMDDEKWDDHLKNEDFFNVEKYPAMTFKSTSVEVTGENTANVTGDLTILDVTKPVVLAVTHNKTGPHPMNGKQVAGFSATTNIKRSDFGMNYGLPMVGDDVEIRLEIEGHSTDADLNEATNQ